jgi:hypothetical protein
LQAVQLLAHGGADVRDGIRDQILMDAEEFHCGTRNR